MADLDRAIAAAREVARARDADAYSRSYLQQVVIDLLAALDAARGQAVAWQSVRGGRLYLSRHDAVLNGEQMVTPLYAASPAAAVSAANVTPMRQPRADLARLVESINAAVYANGNGLSVTEAIGALELAKLELLKEQEQ